MKVMVSDYTNKIYSRSTIKCGDDISSDYILTSVSNRFSDQVVIDMFHDKSNYKISKQGKNVQPYVFTGYLYDTEATPWETRFIDNYLNLWRASLCMRNRRMVEIKYLNMTMIGYMTNLTVVSNNTGISEFSFSFYPMRKSMAGSKSIKITKWPSIGHIKREDAKAVIYNTTTIGNVGRNQSDEFALTSMTKIFRERVQLSGPEESIITFGSHPDRYRFSLSLFQTPNDEDEDDLYSWDERFRALVEDSWMMKNLSANDAIAITYKDRVSIGYILNPEESIKQNQNWSQFAFDFLVVSDRGIVSEES